MMMITTVLNKIKFKLKSAEGWFINEVFLIWREQVFQFLKSLDSDLGLETDLILIRISLEWNPRATQVAKQIIEEKPTKKSLKQTKCSKSIRIPQIPRNFLGFLNRHKFAAFFARVY
jgi:hypothetical protein